MPAILISNTCIRLPQALQGKSGLAAGNRLGIILCIFLCIVLFFPGRLLAVSPADGSTLSELKLEAPPVWDGMSAAGGRLFIACEDGTIIALQ